MLFLVNFLNHLIWSKVITVFFFFFYSFYIRSQLHAKIENTSFTKPFWTDANRSSTWLNNLFDDCQTQSYALMIHFCCSMQFTKATKEFGDVFRGYSRASVFDMNNKITRLGVVVGFNINGSMLCKLSCILDDIKQ